MASSKEIVIVGGGVIGLCTAYYAAQRGHAVRIVERGGPDHDCCSLGNAGLVVPSHFIPLAAPGMVALGLRMMFNPESPFYVRPRLDPDLIRWAWKFYRAARPRRVARASPLLLDLNLASRRCFEELAQLTENRFGLEQRGLLMLCKTQKALEDESHLAESARRLGLQALTLSAEEAARLDPDVRMDIVGAVFFPQDCHLTPQRFVAELTRQLQKANVTFEWNTEATGWRVDHGRITALQTNRGERRAEAFVLAGGSWSPSLVRSLGMNLPIQAGKGYSLTLSRPRQLPSISSLLTEARVAVTPMGSSLRFGGTMELGGLDQSINPRRVDGIIRSVPRYFPDFEPNDFKEVPVWRGLRPCSPDGLPYVGPFRRYPNLYASTGHAMLGLSLGPITGQLLAEIVSGERPSIDIGLLDPNRYC
jgi:D-amino-acid dehydrogenase